MPGEKLNTKRIMFSVACFIQASGLLAVFFIPLTNQDTWIPAIAATLLSLPLALIYCRLMELYPGKSLVGILRGAFGNIAGSIISAFYVYLFFILTVLNTNDPADLIKATIFDKTPKFVVVIIFIALCAWTVRFGGEVITSFSALFSIVSLIIMLVSIAFISNIIDIENFLPMLQQKPFNYLHSTGVILPVIFGETISLLMFAPLFHETTHVRKHFSIGFLMGGGWMLINFFLGVTVLGNTLPLFAQPVFEALKMVQVGGFINRIEVFFAIMFIILLYFKVSVLFFACVTALTELLNLKSFRPLIYSLAILVAVFCTNIFYSSAVHGAVSRTVLSLIWIVLTIIVPLIAVIFGSIKQSKAGANE